MDDVLGVEILKALENLTDEVLDERRLQTRMDLEKLAQIVLAVLHHKKTFIFLEDK